MLALAGRSDTRSLLICCHAAMTVKGQHYPSTGYRSLTLTVQKLLNLECGGNADAMPSGPSVQNEGSQRQFLTHATQKFLVHHLMMLACRPNGRVACSNFAG
jgi:hypothetical protein